MTKTELKLAVQQLAQQLQETRDALTKLAAITQMRYNADEQLEWSIDAQDWALKKRLDELKQNPRKLE